MAYCDSDSEQQKNFLPVDTCQPSISLDQSNPTGKKVFLFIKAKIYRQ